jgi:hypothetical protein
LRGEEGANQPGPLPEDFVRDKHTNLRALEILSARCLEESCRLGIAKLTDKQEKGSLRKGAFYLARIIYVWHSSALADLVAAASNAPPSVEVSSKLVEALNKIGKDFFEPARKLFARALKEYIAKEGGNEDAALKNSKFAEQVDELAKP